MERDAPAAEGQQALLLHAAQLPAQGAAVHRQGVLTEAKDGYLHVCVPRGELTYLADEAGEFGYVPAASIQTAPTPLMLKYLP